jgi:DNA replication protein DnaC
MRGYQKEVRTEELICQTCNKVFEGQVSIHHFSGKDREIRPRECPKCKEIREAKEKQLAEEELQLAKIRVREHWRRTCGVPCYLQEKTFANFDRRFQRGVVEAIERWVDGFLVQGAIGYPSLILYSEEYGVGKTHLAVSMGNFVVDSWDGDPAHAVCPIRFESGPGLIRRIRATYNIRDNQSYHETEEEVYNQLRGVKLLILDDIGKERPSVHTREVYFYIIDERLKMGLPIIITSNLPLEGENSLEQLMGEATVSRLIGMCRGNYFKLTGDDYRRRELKP